MNTKKIADNKISVVTTHLYIDDNWLPPGEVPEYSANMYRSSLDPMTEEALRQTEDIIKPLATYGITANSSKEQIIDAWIQYLMDTTKPVYEEMQVEKEYIYKRF